MDETRHDTKQRYFTIKRKAISLLDTESEVLYQPPVLGREFVVLSAFMQVRTHAGTNSDEPNITIDNGTNGQDIVAAVDSVGHVEGAVQRLTVIGNLLVNYANPLRLRKTDAAGGSTAYDVDIVVALLEISDVA